jgi:hypothetical protein
MNDLKALPILIFLLTLVGASNLAYPQSLEDYKASVAEDGCKSIPFADLRDRCFRASDFVKQDCKNKVYSCEGLETKQLIENIKGKENALQEKKRSRDELERALSGASDSERSGIKDKLDASNTEIDNQTRQLEEMKRALETDQSDARNRKDQGKRCLEARNDVQYLFTSARSSAKSESDPDKKPYAEQLVAKWEKGESDHKDAMRNVDDAIAYCDQCSSGDK